MMKKKKTEVSPRTFVGVGHLPAEIRQAKRNERARRRKLAETLRNDEDR
jgi:hypothetical protein